MAPGASLVRLILGTRPNCVNVGNGGAKRTSLGGVQTVAAMFNPLPAIALLPLALLWFGLGEKSLLFVLALHCRSQPQGDRGADRRHR
ncbi:ABC-type proline/glycine betaine transport system permease subunit [Ancylobacter vacuolatus]|uniref:ABC-type proline/glycine betaine transport system permease subunit n=1 Tax=Ancylobacter vacuolatus TaxID=223389 RepID=A0ABU0DK70_9HYPH|nr:ABC-type proline/glycine betaine transport system permease subunit [Ancylobacter vacuolatus]